MSSARPLGFSPPPAGVPRVQPRTETLKNAGKSLVQEVATRAIMTSSRAPVIHAAIAPSAPREFLQSASSSPFDGALVARTRRELEFLEASEKPHEPGTMEKTQQSAVYQVRATGISPHTASTSSESASSQSSIPSRRRVTSSLDLSGIDSQNTEIRFGRRSASTVAFNSGSRPNHHSRSSSPVSSESDIDVEVTPTRPSNPRTTNLFGAFPLLPRPALLSPPALRGRSSSAADAIPMIPPRFSAPPPRNQSVPADDLKVEDF